MSLIAFVAVGMALGALAGGSLWAWVRREPAEDKTVPIARVDVVQELESFQLAVHNSGTAAEFSAEIEFDIPPLHPVPRKVYAAYWEKGKGSTSKIASGLQDRLWIGLLKRQIEGAQQVELYITDYQGQRAPLVFMFPPPPRSEPQYVDFTVTISADPPMKNGPFVGRYRVTREGLQEAPKSLPGN